MPKSKAKRKRYQPPPKAKPRPSPSWFPPLVLGVIGVAVAVLVLNYLGVLPEAPNNWYLAGGFLLLAGGLGLATRWR
jgi:LPXTG-motif cell wall-anchored protein